MWSLIFFKSFQFATLEQMLSTGRQSAADEDVPNHDPRQFHNWEGKGASQILLPDLEAKK